PYQRGHQRGGNQGLADFGIGAGDEPGVPRAHEPALSSWWTAANRRATSSAVCAADKVTRRRAVPVGTVGGRIAGTHNPCSYNAAATRKASLLSPITSG